ncbi:MAG: TolC family protein, partial [Bryobacterales bacterium]|nr:TolC family protein [Bryobacterales bacterium]
EILRLALMRRPDYLASRHAQNRSQADLRLQLANGKADYTIGTEFTRQSAYGMSGNTLGLYFSVPLQFSNRNQGEIARARQQIHQTASRTAALEATIQTEVEMAYRQFTHSASLLASIETSMLAKAQSVRDTTAYSYRRGEASLIEFLDAQRAFNETMQMYNEARANYVRSIYLLDAVSGATVSGL